MLSYKGRLFSASCGAYSRLSSFKITRSSRSSDGFLVFHATRRRSADPLVYPQIMSCRGLDLEGKYTLANQICQVIEEKCAWASCSDSTSSHCYGIDPTEEFRVGTEVVQREFSCSSDSYCAMFVDQYARSNVGDMYVDTSP